MKITFDYKDKQIEISEYEAGGNTFIRIKDETGTVSECTKKQFFEMIYRFTHYQ